MEPCDDSVRQSTSAIHAEGGGAIPASSLFFKDGCNDDAISLVKRFHYSGRAPTNIQYVGSLHVGGGLFGDYGEMVAAVFFSVPPTRWSEDVLELSRLVRKDGVRVPLTFLISMAAARLKANGNDLLVSFADAAEGHYGTVYQACGWQYHGIRERAMDGLIVNGAFVPGRTCNSLYGTRSPQKLRELKPAWEIEPHYDEGKRLYWRSLGRRGQEKAKRLKLQSNNYPKK